MSDPRRFDDLIQAALAEARAAEPTAAEIRQAVQRSRILPARRRPLGRLIGVVAATAALLSGTALAVPPVRHALADAFGALQDFLTGGATPPGAPIDAGEPPGRLNWFDGSSPATGAVIAQSQQVRLVAFRDPASGLACIGFGLNGEECLTDGDWTSALARGSIIVRGPLEEPDASGRLALIGLTVDAITSIELRYADGGTVLIADVQHGFVLSAEPSRRPLTVTGRDAGGREVDTVDVTNLRWTILTP